MKTILAVTVLLALPQAVPPAVLARAPAPAPTSLLELKHPRGVSSLAFSPDGKLLATACAEGARVWDAATGKEVRNISFKGCRVVRFSPDGSLLALGAEDGSVRLVNPRTGDTVRNLPRAPGAVDLAWSPDGKTLAVAGNDTAVQGYDVGTAMAVKTWKPRDIKVTLGSVTFSPDGKYVLVGGLMVRNEGIHRGWVYQLKADTGHVWADDPGEQFPPAALPVNTGFVPPLAWSADGKLIASAFPENEVHLSEARTNKLKWLSGKLPGRVNQLAFTPDNKTLISAGQDGVLRFWEAGAGNLGMGKEQIALGKQGKAPVIAVSPDGKRLAVGNETGMVRLLDLRALRDKPGSK